MKEYVNMIVGPVAPLFQSKYVSWGENCSLKLLNESTDLLHFLKTFSSVSRLEGKYFLMEMESEFSFPKQDLGRDWFHLLFPEGNKLKFDHNMMYPLWHCIPFLI